MEVEKDAIGRAILDFAAYGKAEDIIVASDICEDDVIPVPYLFRDFEAMPDLEKIALNLCEGKVLDIGAGAGSHSKALLEKGIDVHAIDISPGAVVHMQGQKINAREIDFRNISDEKYDTLLLLMNGIGIASRFNALEDFLKHAKNCLTENGKIICDSTDVSYLYEDEEGGVWMDLNSDYFGDFKFKMSYKETETDWFDWLYIDFNKLSETAEKVGFSTELIFEQENQFLVELKHIK